MTRERLWWSVRAWLFLAALVFGTIALSGSRSRVAAQPRPKLTDRCRECMDTYWPAQCIEDVACTKGEALYYTHPIGLPERQVIALEDIARTLRRMEARCP